jgi:anti-sigma factor RsiW
MMEYQDQLKLQAFLDGELPEADAREVAARLAREPEAGALMGELRQTRESLADGEKVVKLPETREFYWSKIQREIIRLKAAAAEPAARTPLGVLLRRLLVPAAGLAVLIIVGVFAIGEHWPRASASNGVELAVADSAAFTYRDYSSGTTVVWLSYPAENEVADDDDPGTLD